MTSKYIPHEPTIEHARYEMMSHMKNHRNMHAVPYISYSVYPFSAIKIYIVINESYTQNNNKQAIKAQSHMLLKP